MTQRNDFGNAPMGETASPRRAFAITPHATNPLTEVVRAIHCSGAAGFVDVIPIDGDGTTVVRHYVTLGGAVTITSTHVRDTSTATGLVGWP